MSKSTSKSQPKKAIKKPNYWKLTLLLLFAVLLLCVSIMVVSKRAKLVQQDQHCIRLEVSGTCAMQLEYARTTEEQTKGLSERASLPANYGMMFIFLKPDVQCFWMKGMKFPIDIIWLDANKKIAHVEQNVTPETYPKTYCPPVDVQYVLEVNAGEAQKLGLQTGEQLYF